jgi:hypothetical protein
MFESLIRVTLSGIDTEVRLLSAKTPDSRVLMLAGIVTLLNRLFAKARAPIEPRFGDRVTLVMLILLKASAAIAVTGNALPATVIVSGTTSEAGQVAAHLLIVIVLPPNTV